MLIADLYIHIVMGSLLFFTSLFMIFLILIQRGRGGGLAGALGGSGGSSAFGAKAGDTFTKVTAGMAIFWFVLCILAILFIQGPTVSRPTYRDPAVSGTGSGATTGDTEAPLEAAEKTDGPPGLQDLPAIPGLDLEDPSGSDIDPPLDIPPTSEGTDSDRQDTEGQDTEG